MIYSLTGKVILKEDNFVVLETVGIGFKVSVPKFSQKDLIKGKRATLFCFLYQENMEIYGFINHQDLELFGLLNTISGIGPKMALKIINGLSPQKLSLAILSDKSDIISKKCGVSSKTASRIIIELKEKIKKQNFKPEGDIIDDTDLEDVLMGLGYKKREVEYVISKLSPKTEKLSEKIKESLKMLAKPIRHI
ncbi:MAG: Holliday junction branch migration protein RuvA [Candidatus Paceibacterota bacterium]|jgi:Holliday junction DNA helicase RuvA